MPKTFTPVPLAVVVVVALALPAVGAPPPGGAPVGLPYVFRDRMGSTWDVQQDGSIGDGGNDLYDGGARLFVDNNAQYQNPTGQAVLSADRSEVVLPPVTMGAVSVSRRVGVLPALNAVRYVEVIENPTGAAVRVPLRLYFNRGGSIQQALPLAGARGGGNDKGGAPVGYAVGNGRNAVALVMAGRGSKVLPQFQYQLNNDNVNAHVGVDVPARQSVAVVHLQVRGTSVAQAAAAWAGLRDKDLLAGLPKDLRRRVVNFPGGDAFVNDLEVLRGDALDVVELRAGDLYRGTIEVRQYNLQTLYGPITLPADRVVAMLNVGTYRATQLLVTVDGEVFGGRIDLATIPLRLGGGQVTNVPIAQVARLGYRRRGGEPDEWAFDGQPLAALRSGERVRIKPPAGDLVVATPAGPVRLGPGSVASIVFGGDDVTVPEVHLVDGSKLSGLLGAGHFDLTLTGLGPNGHLARVPAAAVTRLQFGAERDVEPLAPSLVLSNGDALVATIAGTLSLETPFDTLHLEGNQIKGVTHSRAGGDHDVTVTLWDDSTVSGRLVESHVTAALRCGVSIRVPVALLGTYAQPLPTPSPATVARIREVARELDADNWRARERAQRQILSLGPATLSILKPLRATAPEESAARIELMIRLLTRELDAAAGGAGRGGAAPGHGFDGADGPDGGVEGIPVPQIQF